MGNCVKASPAKTINPTLSLLNVSTSLEINFFDLPKRLGVTSSASMEFEMSKAMTASTPLRFTVSIFEPNCGRANISITNVNAAKVSQNLMSGRYLEIVGMSPFSNAGSPYLRIFWRR